ncbi:hypothetical protein M0R45_006228 [Rubus argutus]|uniref:Uncharacterized protein n=1 Tax=Rubus argutus TaxID=59490 RepID=A0AAW1YQC1_RUBAR
MFAKREGINQHKIPRVTPYKCTGTSISKAPIRKEDTVDLKLRRWQIPPITRVLLLVTCRRELRRINVIA